MSIGRLYKDHDLGKLVDLILIAYTKQPVDFIMHHFDVLQVILGIKWKMINYNLWNCLDGKQFSRN